MTYDVETLADQDDEENATNSRNDHFKNHDGKNTKRPDEVRSSVLRGQCGVFDIVGWSRRRSLK